MIACIIEFGVRPGMEARHQELLLPLLDGVQEVDGFISKETFDSRNTPGKIITVSYWRDGEAMAAWMKDRDHITAMVAGKKEVFTHYWIQISEVQREYSWEAEG